MAARKRKRIRISEDGWTILAIIAAFLLIKILEVVLNTPTPLVAVYSTSMQHDNPNLTHYSWLAKNFGYSKEYIDSWPFPTGINEGDVAVVSNISQNYTIGDVIVYNVPGVNFPIIHRIIAINPDGTYQTKGDNNLGQLPYEKSVKKEQINGKVIFIFPKIGYFKVLLYKLIGG